MQPENRGTDRLKKRIFDIIQIGNKSDTASRAFDIFIVIVIVINILTMFLETFSELEAWSGVFLAAEIVTLSVFCAEYALRIWTSCYLFPEEGRVKAALRFMRSPDGLVELLTILPFFFLTGMVALRMLRVVRIFHLFRINASYDSFHVITSVLYEKKNQIVSSVFIILVLMLASSLCMYSAEHEAQPENFRNAFSAVWWSMSTLLTVGYGDIYPVTTVGKLMAIVIAFLGVGTVAIPTGIISAGFVEQYTELQNGAPSADISLQTVVVDLDSAWIGCSMEDIERRFGFTVVLAKRGQSTIRSSSSAYRVEMGDVLVVFKGEQEDGCG